MKSKSVFNPEKLKEIGYIVARNVFLLFNGIILFVVILLFVFGETRNGLFIGIILIVNIILGLLQDIRAWVALQKLQLLTTPHVIRINADGTEESVTSEEILKGDRIKLKIGDQVPCDSVLLEANSFELNEGLITGESDSLTKKTGDKILAGSVVTSGAGIIRVESIFHESRIARMTEGVRKFSVNSSPIQRSVGQAVKYSMYVLIVSLIYVAIRDTLMHTPPVHLVVALGTLTSMFVPQGLVFAVTLFFAYGAVHLYNRQVLLQEVNATEKLGRIKNLCMDKTGTLTKNELTVEDMILPPGSDKQKVEQLVSAYILGTGDTSDITQAIKKLINYSFTGTVNENLTFSSWRQYGAVCIVDRGVEKSIFVGLPDIFLPHLSDEHDKLFLQNIIEDNAHKGKRVLCVVEGGRIMDLNNLTDSYLKFTAAFIFHNDLREGILDTINFFQTRGISIRIISGDNPETTRVIAASAGVLDSDKVISGKELELWSEADYLDKVGNYVIFAGIVPEQKEKIVSAFKQNGFTAMIGDGANDALAIKKADLGIAMFDGAPATRQLASVVLMNNSFTALPGGVELADNIITNVEIFSSIFFNQTFIGFLFFVAVSFMGFDYPFTPLNITFINYFAVGIPGLLLSWWTLRPIGKVSATMSQPFLKRVLPFSAISAVFQTLGVTLLFLISPASLQTASSNTFALLSFIIFGFIFFTCAPSVYRESLTVSQKWQVVVFALIEIILLYLTFHVPFVMLFFNITPITLSFSEVVKSLIVIAIISGAQIFVTRWFVRSRSRA